MSKTDIKPAELRNVKGRALRPHTNVQGVPVEKGKTYIHPRPEAEIKAGLVEVDKGEPAKTATKAPAKVSPKAS